MRKVSKSFDVSILRNEIIIQVAFGLNYVLLLYSKGFIQFSGCFSIEQNSDQDNYDEVYPVKSDLGLLQLLEKKITSISLNEKSKKLNLKFEDGISLCLIGNERYESFIIKNDNFEIRI